MEKLPEDFKKRWVEALRSGEYKQGQGYLYNPQDDSYCCMGVCGVILKVSKRSLEKKAYFDSRMESIIRLAPPKGLPELLDRGVSIVPYNLTDLNDSQGKSFSEIADYIEENL